MRRRPVRPLLAVVVAGSLLLVACGGGRAGTPPQSGQSGKPVSVPVSATEPIRVSLPGGPTVTGPAGTVDGTGTMTVTPVEAPSTVAGVRSAGPGLELTVAGARLVRPVHVVFPTGTPAAGEELPVVLHQQTDGRWEPETAETTPAGIAIDTTSFSWRVPGWLDPRSWFKGIADSSVDWITGRTDPPGCANNGPRFATLTNRTSLLHACLSSNPDPAGGPVRAEAQFAPNRRFFVWVSLPPGAQYSWVADQPSALRTGLGRLFHFADDHQVLLGTGSRVTAGFTQPDAATTAQFTGYIDGTSAALSLTGTALGLAGLESKRLLPAMALLAAECSGDIPSSSQDVAGTFKFFQCAVTSALGKLDNPDKALSAAMDLFGEAAYAKDSEDALTTARNRLRLLGKVLKIVGLVGAVRDIWTEVPDAYSQIGNDRPGDATLALAANPNAVKPVLGLAGRLINGAGWGEVAPSHVFNGGDPNGNVTSVSWSGWGGQDAYGTGQGSIFRPEGGYYAEPATLQLRATDIGTCTPGGPRAYRQMFVRWPAVPGGPLGPWQPWGPTDGDICHGV